MKKMIGMAFSLSVVAMTAACGPSLGEYVGRSATYHSMISTNASVSVNIEPNDVTSSRHSGTLGIISSVVNTAGAIGALALSADQQLRLQNVVSPHAMAQNVAMGFDSGFTGSTHLQVVPPDANPDIRIMLNIDSYGIWAESLTSPMNFFVEAELTVVFTPEMRTVYSSGVSIVREVGSALNAAGQIAANVSANVAGQATQSYHTAVAVYDVASLGAGVANLAAFLQMSDAELSSAFYYMAVDAGAYIANQLVRNIYR